MPVDAVATIGPHVDPDALGAIPSNVRVERFVPQGWLLPRVTGVISHGGAGTVLGAAAHGRPQLVVPLFADQWENGLAVVDAGCGAVLGPDHRGDADVATAVRELLDDPGRRAAAASVAVEVAAMPTAAELVPHIEALVPTELHPRVCGIGGSGAREPRGKPSDATKPSDAKRRRGAAGDRDRHAASRPAKIAG